MPDNRATVALHLAPGHVPFDTRVFHKEARTLAGAGYRVIVAAPDDGDEERDGVRIAALPRPRSRLSRFVLGPLRLIRLAWRTKADITHVHDIEALPAALVLALAGRTVVIDSHEDYPRLVLSRSWIPRPLRNPLSRVVAAAEQVVARRVAAIISAEDVGAQRFPPEKTVVVRNYALPEEFPDAGPVPGDRPPNAVYVGDITPERGAREMVDAAARVSSRFDGRLILAGRMPPSLQAELSGRPGWAATDYRGVVDRQGVRRVLAEARVGLVLWHPLPKFSEGAVPVKLFEYLAAGLPVVAADLPHLRRVVEATGGGVLVDPLDVDAVAEAIEGLLADSARAARLGATGRAAVLERYSWPTEAVTLLELYARLTRRAPQPSLAAP